MAAFALGLAASPLAVDRLLASLKDADGQVRARAAEALGRIGDARAAVPIARLVVDALPKTIDRMTVRGDDPGDPAAQWSEQRLALFALARLKDVAAARLALLDGGRPRFDWWASTWVAMRLESPQLRPVLVAAAASDEPQQRALAARGLGALRDASAVELLLPLARDPDEAVGLQALRALGVLGDARGRAPATAALDAPSDVLRREALRTLARLPPEHALGERLVREVSSRDPWIRGAALEALEVNDRDDFALVLSGMGPDRDFRVRAALASCPRPQRQRDERGDPARDAARRGPARRRGCPGRARRGAREGLARHPQAAPGTPRPGRARGSRRSRRGSLAGRDVRAAPRRLASRPGRRRGRARGAPRRGGGARRPEGQRRPRGPRRGGASRPVARGARARGDAAARRRAASRSTPARSRSRAPRSTTARRWRPTTRDRACRSTRRAPS